MILRSLYRFGRSTLHWTANRLDPPVVVLLYHRVTTLESDPQLLAVTPANFRDQIKYLKDNYLVLRFEADWSRIKEPSIVVTFDDGYADNALEVLPIIEEIGIPATFFISTGTVGTQKEFWWDELERIILGQRSYPSRFELRDSQFRQVWPTTTKTERQTLYGAIHQLIKTVDTPRRENWLQQLRDWAQSEEHGRETHRAMTVAELRDLSKNKWVTIGAHAITHIPLSSLPVIKQREEIIGSKKQIEAWLEQKVTVFSYPFGCKGDYTQESVELCKEAGLIKAAANFPGQAHRWTDPYQIPRQLIRNWSLDEFVKKISGFWIL